WTRITDVVVAQKILDLLWRRLIDKIPAPAFGLVRAARLPYRDCARLAGVQGGVREDLAGASDDPRPFAPCFAAFGFAVREIFGNGRRMGIGRWGRLTGW